ncbi:MAG: endo-1,4-beta-xylanase [Bacillota bacterium]|nr:endo-1,4-beta-xylanase [Bacillota bacterium]
MSVNSNYKHRTAEKTLKLVTKNGAPIRNKEVLIEQTKHKFLFGASIFECLPLANGILEGAEKAKAEIFFEKFFDIFNYGTMSFYWNRFEPKKGQPITRETMKASEWLISKGVTLKGHPLCWHTQTAPWLLEMNNKEILEAQIKRIERDVTEFKGIIDMWDVINEVVIMPIFDKYDNGITRLCKDLGRIGIVREMFDAAKKANPGATLLINDFNTSISYEILIEGCLEAGIPIDAIGIQSHMHQGYWGVEKTLEVLERYSHFNLPIHFTENTIVSGKIMPPHIEDLNDYVVDEWPSTPEGEDRQAREIITHYKTLFAHPLVESITWWNFADGRWLGAPGGLIRKDSSSKPAYDQLLNLIKKDWWTEAVKAVTNEVGEVTFTGFLGDYDVTLEDKKVSFKLDKNDNIEVITL